MSDHNTPGAGDKQASMLDSFQIFNYSWDTQTTRKNPGQFPNIVMTYRPLGLGFYGSTTGQTPQQFIKLQQMFNMYEEFTILEETVRYQPMFQRSDMAAMVGGFQSDLTGAPYWAAFSVMMADTSVVTLIPEKNDRDSDVTQDLYFQVRGRPEARTFPLNKPYTWTVRPTVNDLRIVNNPNALQTGRSANPFMSDVLQGVANGGSYAEWGPPEKLGWLPTKVVNTQNQWILNTSPGYWGYKEFFYTPNNIATGISADIQYGIKMHTMTFAFRKYDYRNLVAIPAALVAREEDLQDVLNDVTERQMLTDEVEEPAFKRAKTDTEAQQDQIRSRVIVP